MTWLYYMFHVSAQLPCPLSSKETTRVATPAYWVPKGRQQAGSNRCCTWHHQGLRDKIFIIKKKHCGACFHYKQMLFKRKPGGAVVDLQGEVVGIVFATSTTYNNIGYALASEAVRKDVLWAITTTKPLATQPCVSERK